MFCLRRLTRVASGFAKPSLSYEIERKTLIGRYLLINRKIQDDSGKVTEDEDYLKDEEYEEMSAKYLGVAPGGHKALVLQPYVKWGSEKKRNTTPELQLEEAVALLNTLPNWMVVDKLCVSLMNLKKKRLLGFGNLESLKKRVRGNPEITAVFVSANLLKHVQIVELESALGVPIYDRYSIVVQIFRAHARSNEARLQVALAEIPYMWKKLNIAKSGRSSEIGIVESRQKLLQARETKLKNSLKKIRAHRELLRSKRVERDIPTIAVVGYTNAGKTSLIKALTGDAKLQPRNCLFATLDVTVHQGYLPSRLKVLFVDTIGFIQEVPSTLIEPFVATLEDAVNADVIVHVNDASHPDRKAQMDHVEATIKDLITDQPVINVANKIDLVKNGGEIPTDMIGVSATNFTGIDILLEEINEKLLKATGRSVIRIRVESGSRAAAWLYKETAVINVQADTKDSQYSLMDVVATQLQFNMFKKFLRQRNE